MDYLRKQALFIKPAYVNTHNDLQHYLHIGNILWAVSEFGN